MNKIKQFFKWIFKYRYLRIWWITFYWSQDARWELGVCLDVHERTLVSINIIALHIEFQWMQDDPPTTLISYYGGKEMKWFG